MISIMVIYILKLDFDLNYSITIYDHYNINCPLFVDLSILKIGNI